VGIPELLQVLRQPSVVPARRILRHGLVVLLPRRHRAQGPARPARPRDRGRGAGLDASARRPRAVVRVAPACPLPRPHHDAEHQHRAPARPRPLSLPVRGRLARRHPRLGGTRALGKGRPRRPRLLVRGQRPARPSQLPRVLQRSRGRAFAGMAVAGRLERGLGSGPAGPQGLHGPQRHPARDPVLLRHRRPRLLRHLRGPPAQLSAAAAVHGRARRPSRRRGRHQRDRISRASTWSPRCSR
jgi:hypothetical protein